MSAAPFLVPEVMWHHKCPEAKRDYGKPVDPIMTLVKRADDSDSHRLTYRCPRCQQTVVAQFRVTAASDRTTENPCSPTPTLQT